MHKTKVITLAVLTLLFAATQAHADINTLMTFDDLTGGAHDQGPIPDGYNGLHWSNFFFMNALTNDPSGPIIGDPNMDGYRNGIVSNSNIAYNGGGGDAFFFADPNVTFTLTSAYFTSTAYWLNTSYVDVTGLDSNFNAVATDHIAINEDTPTQVTFGWSGLNGVQISTDPSGNNSGFDVAIDNVQLGDPNLGNAAVPEPGAIFLLGTVGLALLPLVRRNTPFRSA